MKQSARNIVNGMRKSLTMARKAGSFSAPSSMVRKQIFWSVGMWSMIGGSGTLVSTGLVAGGGGAGGKGFRPWYLAASRAAAAGSGRGGRPLAGFGGVKVWLGAPAEGDDPEEAGGGVSPSPLVFVFWSDGDGDEAELQAAANRAGAPMARPAAVRRKRRRDEPSEA